MSPAPCFGNESRLARVSRYSVLIARELRLPEEDIDRSRIAALLRGSPRQRAARIASCGNVRLIRSAFNGQMCEAASGNAPIRSAFEESKEPKEPKEPSTGVLQWRTEEIRKSGRES